jgi:tetratricopeptide (TPR) repeat protein
VHYNIGACYLRLENFVLAKEWFEKGLKFLPNDVDLFYGMVMLGIQVRDSELIEKYAKLFLNNVDYIIENKESVGSRFMFNLDSDFKKGILINYFEALLHNNKIDEVDKSINIYEEMLGDKQLAMEVLEKFNDCNDPSLLIKYSLILGGLHPDDSSLLKPIILNLDEKRIDAASLKNSIIEYSKDDNYEVITKLVILSMHLNKLNCAEEITSLFSDAELPKDIQLANNTIIDFYNGSKENLIENTSELIQHGYSDIDYYLILIPHLYISGNFELLQDTLELIIPKYEDFEDIPDIILLPLAKTLLNNNDIDFFIQVIQVITNRFQEFNDNIINSVSDLGTVLLELSQIYQKQNRMHLAEFSLDVAFSLTNDPKYIEKRGQVAFNRGDFRRSLEYFSEALDRNLKEPEMVKNMSVIFEEYGDETGKAYCDQILAELHVA